MEFITKKGGKKVVMPVADFQDALELQNIVAQVAADSGLKLDIDRSKPFNEQDFDIGSLLGSSLRIISSRAIQAQAMKCLSRSTYDSERISFSTFEPEGAREDFYEIMTACLRVNLGPLVQSLFSLFISVAPLIMNPVQAKSQE